MENDYYLTEIVLFRSVLLDGKMKNSKYHKILFIYLFFFFGELK